VAVRARRLGGAGLDYLTLALILEEIAAGDGATSTVVSVNNCPVCSILMAFGNDGQKQRFLKPLARGEMLGAFCLTEPHVGSEAVGLRTTAVRDGDHYVLNGVKQFITSGKNGHVAIVMASPTRRRQEGHQRLPGAHRHARLRGGAAGRQDGPAQQRHGADQLRQLPRAGREPASATRAGLKIALSGLEGGRIGIAAQSVGMARSAFDAALAYSQGAPELSAPHLQPPGGGFRWPTCATQIEAARQLIWHAASLRDAGRPA
jgi:butyryl-CoA dehydrogenase